jgi:hypothetical protein
MKMPWRRHSWRMKKKYSSPIGEAGARDLSPRDLQRCGPNVRRDGALRDGPHHREHGNEPVVGSHVGQAAAWLDRRQNGLDSGRAPRGPHVRPTLRLLARPCNAWTLLGSRCNARIAGAQWPACARIRAEQSA